MRSRQFHARLNRLCFAVVGVGLLIGALSTSPVHGQLPTLSAGDSDSQWRQAQLQAFDSQLADDKLPEELKREIAAQRAWLEAWNPKSQGGSSSAVANAEETPPNSPPNKEAADENEDQAGENKKQKDEDKNSQQAKAIEEPTIDPDGLAEEMRERLFDPKHSATVADTKALQTALTEHSGDVGLRQLQLQWIDQPTYRDAHWQDIATAADRVLGLVSELPATDETKAAAAFANYRKARALAHALRGRPLREAKIVGANKLSDDEREQMQNAIGECWRQIETLVGAGHREFFQLEIYNLRRYGWSGQALELLERNASAVDQAAYLAERKSILEALGWAAPAQQTAKLIKSRKASTESKSKRPLEIQYVPPKGKDAQETVD